VISLYSYAFWILVLATAGVGTEEFLHYAWAASIDCTGKSYEEKCLGTIGDDVMTGSITNDQMRGLEGNDQMTGGPGDDRLQGQKGSDQLRGNAGNDFVNGLEDDDQVTGGEGADRLFGGSGSDKIWGGPGDDTIYHCNSSPSNPAFDSDGEKDTIYCGDGIDKAYYNSQEDFANSDCEVKNDLYPSTLQGNEDCDRAEMCPSESESPSKPPEVTTECNWPYTLFC
jgi:Ca2+-binding RTX toxin-like protein